MIYLAQYTNTCEIIRRDNTKQTLTEIVRHSLAFVSPFAFHKYETIIGTIPGKTEHYLCFLAGKDSQKRREMRRDRPSNVRAVLTLQML